jgi:hypothetical protein
MTKQTACGSPDPQQHGPGPFAVFTFLLRPGVELEGAAKHTQCGCRAL